MDKKHFIGSIIDFEIKGSRVRFFLGLKDPKWGWINKDYVDEKGNKPTWLKPVDDYYGDDWDDIPYEHNAGRVYDEFIMGVRDYYFDANWIIVEPGKGENNSSYCKNDLKNRCLPCVIVIKNKLASKYKMKESFRCWYDFLIKNGNGEEYDSKDIEAFYFEDILMAGITLETDKCSLTF